MLHLHLFYAPDEAQPYNKERRTQFPVAQMLKRLAPQAPRYRGRLHSRARRRHGSPG